MDRRNSSDIRTWPTLHSCVYQDGPFAHQLMTEIEAAYKEQHGREAGPCTVTVAGKEFELGWSRYKVMHLNPKHVALLRETWKSRIPQPPEGSALLSRLHNSSLARAKFIDVLIAKYDELYPNDWGMHDIELDNETWSIGRFTKGEAPYYMADPATIAALAKVKSTPKAPPLPEDGWLTEEEVTQGNPAKRRMWKLALAQLQTSHKWDKSDGASETVTLHGKPLCFKPYLPENAFVRTPIQFALDETCLGTFESLAKPVPVPPPSILPSVRPLPTQPPHMADWVPLNGKVGASRNIQLLRSYIEKQAPSSPLSGGYAGCRYRFGGREGPARGEVPQRNSGWLLPAPRRSAGVAKSGQKPVIQGSGRLGGRPVRLLWTVLGRSHDIASFDSLA